MHARPLLANQVGFKNEGNSCFLNSVLQVYDEFLAYS